MGAKTTKNGGGYDGYLFDLDGTLVDSAPDYQQAAARMLAHFDLPPRPLDEVRGFIGDGLDRFVKRVLTGQWWGEPEAEFFRRARALMDRHYHEVCAAQPRVYDGALSGLRALAQQRRPLACVTNKPEKFTAPVLAAAGLTEFFSAVVCGDTLAEKKPHPAPLLFACDKMNIAPPRALMVGDSAADAKAAAAAGCDFFAVRYGYCGRGGVQKLRARRIIDSVAELVA